MRPAPFAVAVFHAREVCAAALDKWRFRSGRADYYEYLAALMEGMQGRRTLREIFAQDARRYGMSSVRGRLSSGWAQAYQATGGDLYVTWLGCFPMAELALIRVAQSHGNTALMRTLHELGDAVRLIRRAMDILYSTLWSAAIALAVLATLLLAVPLFTVPHLHHTFGAVPAEYYGALTRRLFGFSAWIHAYGLFISACLAGGALLALWSLPNFTGRWRRVLDGYALWRIYRHVNAVRFLAVLIIVLARTGSTQLRAALAMLKTGASAWAISHLDAMLARIDSGSAGADTFDTGLFDRDLYWFLSDMAMARGLDEGLELVRRRIRTQVIAAVARQALVLRWSLLLFCVAGLLSLTLWHYAVIDELRRSLMFFYASQ